MPRNTPKVPLPGIPVKGSKTGRPIMAALDLLGRRWALRILWELRDGPVGFRQLQARCGGMSPSVLSTRLRELETAQIIAATPEQQSALTPLGHDLVHALMPLSSWATNWQAHLAQSAPLSD